MVPSDFVLENLTKHLLAFSEKHNLKMRRDSDDYMIICENSDFKNRDSLIFDHSYYFVIDLNNCIYYKDSLEDNFIRFTLSDPSVLSKLEEALLNWKYIPRKSMNWI